MADLTSTEGEFIAEMRDAQPPPEERWHNFDPDFRQKDIDRLIRRGCFEKRTHNGYREYRWTDAGRQALADAEAAPLDRLANQGGKHEFWGKEP